MADNVIILAGGQGKRMKSDKPKALCKVLGEPMLEWVISACEDAGVENICVVKGFMGEYIDEYLSSRKGRAEIVTVEQKERLGTGHAVMQATDYLKARNGGNTLVLCGDAPFIDKDTIAGALELHKSAGCGVTVVTSKIDDPTGYGRIIRTENGISGIVEHKDCTPQQREINEINSGCYWFETQALLNVLGEIKPNNAQGEYYLTDCVGLIIAKGKRADAFISANPNVSLGANDRKGLLELNDIARKAVIAKWLDEGIEFTCTDGVSVGRKVTIGVGSTICQNVTLSGSTTIGKDCYIGSSSVIDSAEIGEGSIILESHIYGAKIAPHTSVGPFEFRK